MKFILEINCDNAAFETSPEVEVSYILDNISKRVEYGEVIGNAKDTNGNTGSLSLSLSLENNREEYLTSQVQSVHCGRGQEKGERP